MSLTTSSPARRCLIPGSFDPPTNGHLDVITRARRLYDAVVVAVVHNPNKQGLFAPAERVALLQAALEVAPDGQAAERGHQGADAAGRGAVRVVSFSDGLLVDLCRELGVEVILKGVRGAADVDYESAMAGMNRHLTGVETLYLGADHAWSFVSSSLVKEVAGRGGDVTALVPTAVARALTERFGQARGLR